MFNVSEVRSLAEESPTSKAVFSELARRPRNRPLTNLYQFKKLMQLSGSSVNAEQYILVFKKLEELGIGTLVRGRKTKSGFVSPMKFIWSYSLKDVAQAGTQPGKPQSKQPTKQPAVPPSEASHNVISVNREGISIHIDLNSLPSSIKPENVTAWLSLVKDLEK